MNPLSAVLFFALSFPLPMGVWLQGANAAPVNIMVSDAFPGNVMASAQLSSQRAESFSGKDKSGGAPVVSVEGGGVRSESSVPAQELDVGGHASSAVLSPATSDRASASSDRASAASDRGSDRTSAASDQASAASDQASAASDRASAASDRAPAASDGTYLITISSDPPPCPCQEIRAHLAKLEEELAQQRTAYEDEEDDTPTRRKRGIYAEVGEREQT